MERKTGMPGIEHVENMYEAQWLDFQCGCHLNLEDGE